MKRLLLFRHALATHSLHGYGDKILSAKILPEGIPPIERMAAFLKEMPTDRNFVSPVVRCQQTVEIMEKINGKVFITDKRLTEFQGEQPTETFVDLRNRCQNFLDEIRSLEAESILVCSHGGVIATLKYLLLTGTFTEAEQYEYPATGELWIIHDHKVESFDFN
jgi:broad specificity phosphatase PhoE